MIFAISKQIINTLNSNLIKIKTVMHSIFRDHRSIIFKWIHNPMIVQSHWKNDLLFNFSSCLKINILEWCFLSYILLSKRKINNWGEGVELNIILHFCMKYFMHHGLYFMWIYLPFLTIFLHRNVLLCKNILIWNSFCLLEIQPYLYGKLAFNHWAIDGSALETTFIVVKYWSTNLLFIILTIVLNV